MSILEQFQSPTKFVPSTPTEYFALQLAKKIDDLGNLLYYVSLAQRFGQDHLLAAFGREVRQGRTDLIERFRSHFQ